MLEIFGLFSSDSFVALSTTSRNPPRELPSSFFVDYRAEVIH